MVRVIFKISVTAVCLAGLLAGCNASSEPPTTTPQPTEPMVSNTPTVTPLPSQTPTASATIPPPPLPDSLPSDFLFGVSTADCELPCWYGLRAGSSTRDDVYAVLDTILGFNGYRPPPEETNLEGFPDNLELIGHGWRSEETGSMSFFSLAAYLDKQSNSMEGLGFGWTGDSRFRPFMTLERVLRELGEPSYMLVDISIGGPPDVFNVRISVETVFATGIEHYHTEGFPVTERVQTTEGIQPSAALLCLGDNDPYANGGAFLMKPLDGGLDKLSPFQRVIINPDRFISIEDITTVSLAEITELAIQQDNACIRLDLEKFR